MTSDPTPFEIAEKDGIKVATNGTLSLTLLEPGRLFRRRAVKGLNLKPAGEAVLPALNELAGRLLANPGMSAQAVSEELGKLYLLLPEGKPQKIEWAVAELDGVRVYTDGTTVLVTKQDLMP